MVLDNSLFSTQHYKVGIKGKVEQSKKRSSVVPLHFGVVAIEKGTFESLDYCSQLTVYIYIYIYIYISSPLV